MFYTAHGGLYNSGSGSSCRNLVRAGRPCERIDHIPVIKGRSQPVRRYSEKTSFREDSIFYEKTKKHVALS